MGSPIRPRALVAASAASLLGIGDGTPIEGPFLDAAVRAMRGVLYDFAQGREAGTDVEIVDPAGGACLVAPACNGHSWAYYGLSAG